LKSSRTFPTKRIAAKYEVAGCIRGCEIKLAKGFRAALHLCAMNTSVNANGKYFRVLGIDPAAAGPTGFGVVESNGRDVRVVHYGTLRPSAASRKEGHGAGLREVYDRLAQILVEFLPDAVAVESVFTALNMKTALRLAEVRGVVLLAAAQHGVPVRSYSPREVKSCVAGYGQASKEQMQLMVRAVLRMDETPEPSDAADALAVAVCHVQGENARVRFALPVASKKTVSRAGITRPTRASAWRISLPR
jgi:crossover junction endodeoxyribonuclease RuvC